MGRARHVKTGAKVWLWAVGILGGLSLLLLVTSVVLMPFRWAHKAAVVVEEQIDPRELLRKYEWFKDASATLNARKAGIKVLQARIDAVGKGTDRTEREQIMVWHQELAGLKLSYNELAATYNSQMAKINWRFTNQGMLPQGATETLPREFAPYVEG